jgi:hypothetical protein
MTFRCEDPRPKSGKSRLNLSKWHHFGGEINWFEPPQKKGATKGELMI